MRGKNTHKKSSLSKKKLSLSSIERAAKAAARQAAREAPADVSTWFPVADGPWEETRGGKRAAAAALALAVREHFEQRESQLVDRYEVLVLLTLHVQEHLRQ